MILSLIWVYFCIFLPVSHGAIRAAADVLRLPGQVPHPQAAAMPALLLHGALHGGPGGLCATTGE